MATTEHRVVKRLPERDRPRRERTVGYPFVYPGMSTDGAPLDRKEEELLFLCGIVAPTSPGWPYYLIKRVADYVIALIMILLLTPVFVIVALAIWLEDRGPILYRQTRIGQNGVPFTFYKFRSMVPHADTLKAHLEDKNESTGPTFKMKQDPRITRVGRFIRKFSIDELPQFFNVLKGQISLVGPRPHLPHEVERYVLHERDRLKVKPGLVCLREVCGRSGISFERWVELDLMYIRCRSLKTDLHILMRAVPRVLRGEGAY